MKRRIMAVLVAVIMIMTTLVPCALAEGEDKKEMVYVLADASGAANDIVVSERLYNRDGEKKLSDVSTLTGIENLGGDESFSVDGDNIVWDADGADIRYEGKSDKPLPVGVNMTYTLDGKEIAPADLAGKSGHLEITIEYQANEKREVTVGEGTEEMPIPFLMATVMLCKDGVFENVEVTNGRLVDVGDRQLILCVGLPGLSDALKLDTYEDVDIEIPTTATISADVTDFASDGTYTIATNSIFGDMDTDDFSLDIDVDDVKDELTDARDQLLDGAQELLDGLSDLKDGTDDLVDGVGQLQDGAGELADGLDEIDENSDTLVDAARQVLETVIDTANEQLAQSKDSFDKLGIELNELTVENYDAEITRIQTELLDKVEDYVLEQADKTLKGKVNSAVRDEVVRQVNEAATAKVEAAVNAAVEEQVRPQVEAAARAKVEAAVRNPDEATLNAEIDKQMQTDAVKAEIEQNVKAQMESDAVKAMIEQQLEAAVRTKVEAAYKENIHATIESGYADSIREQVTAAYREQIRQQILATMTATPAPAEEATESNSVLKAIWNVFASRANADAADIDALVEEKLNSEEIQAAISAAVSTKIDELTNEKLASDEIKAAIGAEIQKQMADPDVRAQAQAQAEATVRAKVEEAAREKIKNVILSMSDEQVNAIVDQKMASDEVKAQIEAALKEQMKSDTVKAIIDKNVKEQLASDAVKAEIDKNVKEQLDSTKVKKIIDEKITENRHSKEYMDSVSEALEENGENGEAYQALVKLHDTLDDMCKFYEGIVDYTDAVGQAKDGAHDLKDGVADLMDGSLDLQDGAQQLYDGMSELNDGLNELNEEALEKLLDYLNGDITDLKDRLEAMVDIARAYNSYAGIAEGKTGTVQFLIHTAGI